MASSTRTLLLKLFVVACTLTGSNCFTCGSTEADYADIKYRNDGHSIVCNGTCLESGIYSRSDSMYWTNCLNVGSKGDESSINAFWRVYTCVLAKHKDNATETETSFLEFSQIATSYYPEQFIESINSLAKSLVKTHGKDNPWLTSKIKLTDYSNVDKIRAQYFNIEKAFCENGTDISLENTFTLKSWDKCSLEEEELTRGSDCCGNNSLLIPRYYDSPLSPLLFSYTECERKLKSGLGELLKNNSTKENLIEMCAISCYLVKKAFMTIDEIWNVKMDESQMRLIVNATYPYIPTQMQKSLAEKMVTMYNETFITQEVNSIFVQHFNLTNFTEDEKSFLHSCAAIGNTHSEIRFYQLACPEPEDGAMNYNLM